MFPVPTLHERVEGSGGGEVGGDGDVFFVGALGLDPDGAVHVTPVAAHSARRVGDVRQAPVAVIPAERRDRRWPGRGKGRRGGDGGEKESGGGMTEKERKTKINYIAGG